MSREIMNKLRKHVAEEIIMATDRHDEEAIRKGWQMLNDIQTVVDAYVLWTYWDSRPWHLLWEDAQRGVTDEDLNLLVRSTAALLHARWCRQRYGELLDEAERRGLC